MSAKTVDAAAVTDVDGDGAILAGRYRVVRQLGQGGMGSVWLANDEKLDGHPVAIKMLPAVLVTNRRAYAQVKHEALVALKLSHSNIATVRAFEEDNGNPFLVMDYIDGQSLDDLLGERRQLTEEETVRLLGPVADALDSAHAAGVIHRDVKPGNVMIAKGGKPYVLDFGIAREIQETVTRVTGQNSSGTLLYMSPEQLHGAEPSVAQDVYSFAAMAYECLTGHPPFYRGEIARQIEQDEPEAIKASVGIGGEVMRGLAKDPAARPESCRMVLELAKRKPSRPTVRRPLAVAGLCLAAAAAGVGAFVCLRPASRPDEPERRPDASTNSVPPTPQVEVAANRPVERPAPPPEPKKVEAVKPAPAAMAAAVAPTNAVVAPTNAAARPPRPPEPKPTADEQAKAFAVKMAGRLAGVREAVAEADRATAREEWQCAESRYREGKRLYDAARYVAATGSWAGVETLYVGVGPAADGKRRRQAAEACRDEVRTVLNQATDAVKQDAGERLAAAWLEFRKGEARLGAGDLAAATNCWQSSRSLYAAALAEAGQAAARREGERQRREERQALLARLARGSQFLPDPPKRAPGERRTVKLPDGSLLTFVWCPPGRFLMGSPAQEPKRDSGETQHLVMLTKGFWIGRCEVTRAQWKSVMGSSRFMLSALIGADGDYPVDEVSWLQCMDFCRRLSQYARISVRLPTEAEWEYACRAGTATPFSFGSALNGDRACCAGGEPYGPVGPGSNSYTGVARVGSYQPNPWGICDMHGNVFEWCADFFGDYPEGDATDPTGPASGRSRVRRGGCWNFYPRQCRSAFRSRWNPEDNASHTGLRVCCDDL